MNLTHSHSLRKMHCHPSGQRKPDCRTGQVRLHNSICIAIFIAARIARPLGLLEPHTACRGGLVSCSRVSKQLQAVRLLLISLSTYKSVGVVGMLLDTAEHSLQLLSRRVVVTPLNFFRIVDADMSTRAHDLVLIVSSTCCAERAETRCNGRVKGRLSLGFCLHFFNASPARRRIPGGTQTEKKLDCRGCVHRSRRKFLLYIFSIN